MSSVRPGVKDSGNHPGTSVLLVQSRSIAGVSARKTPALVGFAFASSCGAAGDFWERGQGEM